MGKMRLLAASAAFLAAYAAFALIYKGVGKMTKACFILGAVCGALGAFAAGPQQGPVAVKTSKATTVEETEPYVVVARTVGAMTIKITARVVGTLWEQNGKEGDAVKKGDVLYRIEDTIYKANLKTAKAKAAELRAKLELAELEAARYTATETKGGVSRSERDRVVLARDVAKAELEAAEAQVTLCENDLSYCTILSPIDGILGICRFDAGNNVGPQVGELGDVIQTDPIDVVAAIPEQRMFWAFEKRDVKRNAHIRMLRSDGQEVPVGLKLHAIDNKVDSATGTVMVRFRCANPDGKLRPGAYVKLLMSARYDQPKLAIPLAALVFEGEKRFVYVVKDGKAEKRAISVGEQQGDRILVESGLAADESFVVAGTHKLSDGAAVKEQ